MHLSKAILATCMALALPAALAVPYHDGSGMDADRSAWLSAHGGWLVAAYAQGSDPALDNDLGVDIRYDIVFVGPNQLNITWTKNANANTSSYKLTMDGDDSDGNFDYELRNVTAVAGSGTTTHTLTFDGPPVGKDAATYVGTTSKGLVIGPVTNTTGMLWGGWSADWEDYPDLYQVVGDAQRPGVVSAKITSASTLEVAYDEAVTFVQAADYSLVLNSGDTVAVTSVLADDGSVLSPYTYSTMHVLGLERSLSLDEIGEIKELSIINITDESQYIVNGNTTIGNQLEIDTVAVMDGLPPMPIRAEIVGPLQINVTFSKPVNSSPANYANLTIISHILDFDARNRTVSAVAGNGTATHTLTIDMPDKPIPLPPTGPKATGYVDIDNVIDMEGNTMAEPAYLSISDARTRDGVPWMIAARFTGPNEITISYNASATVADYSALVTASSMPNAPRSSWIEHTWSRDMASTSSVENYTGTFVMLDIASVEGNGTTQHTLMVAGGGVSKTATGLINVTGLAQGDGTPASDYVDAPVYDEQLPRVVSTRITANNTVIVEYDQLVFGPLSGYLGVSTTVDRMAAPENGTVTRVLSGSMDVLRPISEATRLLGSLPNGSFVYGNYSDVPTRYPVMYPQHPWTPGYTTPTMWVADPPVVLNRSTLVDGRNRGNVVGYAGDLFLSDGTTAKIEVLGPWLLNTTDMQGASGIEPWSPTWLVRSDDLLSLHGVEYMNIHSNETAVGCQLVSTPGAPGAANVASMVGECAGLRMPGTHHMLTVDGLSVGGAYAASLEVSKNITSGNLVSNGDTLEQIGVSYRPADEDLYDQQVSNDRTATVDLSRRTFADYRADPIPLGAYNLSSIQGPSEDFRTLRLFALYALYNPSIHVGPNDAVLQMRFAEPVVPSSINPAEIRISLSSGTFGPPAQNINVSGRL